jgi:hypothetical protein
MDIQHEETDGRGRFSTSLDGGPQAEMTYRRHGDVLVFDHTYVPPAYRGKGVAGALMRHAVAHVEAAGERIRPVCSYVVAQFGKHPEWAELRA